MIITVSAAVQAREPVCNVYGAYQLRVPHHSSKITGYDHAPTAWHQSAGADVHGSYRPARV